MEKKGTQRASFMKSQNTSSLSTDISFSSKHLPKQHTFSKRTKSNVLRAFDSVLNSTDSDVSFCVPVRKTTFNFKRSRSSQRLEASLQGGVLSTGISSSDSDQSFETGLKSCKRFGKNVKRRAVTMFPSLEDLGTQCKKKAMDSSDVKNSESILLSKSDVCVSEDQVGADGIDKRNDKSEKHLLIAVKTVNKRGDESNTLSPADLNTLGKSDSNSEEESESKQNSMFAENQVTERSTYESTNDSLKTNSSLKNDNPQHLKNKRSPEHSPIKKKSKSLQENVSSNSTPNRPKRRSTMTSNSSNNAEVHDFSMFASNQCTSDNTSQFISSEIDETFRRSLRSNLSPRKVPSQHQSKPEDSINKVIKSSKEKESSKKLLLSDDSSLTEKSNENEQMKNSNKESLSLNTSAEESFLNSNPSGTQPRTKPETVFAKPNPVTRPLRSNKQKKRNSSHDTSISSQTSLASVSLFSQYVQNSKQKKAFLNQSEVAVEKTSMNLRRKKIEQKSRRATKVKVYRPAYWVTDKLYQFLKEKVNSETVAVDFLKFLYESCNKIMDCGDHKRNERIALLKECMYELRLVDSNFMFFNFVEEFLPREVSEKIVPCAVPFRNNCSIQDFDRELLFMKYF